MSAPTAQRPAAAPPGPLARAAAAHRRGPTSARMARAVRHLALAAVVSALIGAVAIVSLRVGSLTLSLQEISDTLAGGGTRASRLLILTWRLPRILLAIAAGAALAGWVAGGYLLRIGILLAALLGGRAAGLDTKVIGISLIAAIVVGMLAETTVLARTRILAVETKNPDTGA